MRRELNAFGRLRQGLVHMQTANNALGRLPRPSSTYTQPFRPVRVMEASIWARVQDVQEFLSSNLITQLRGPQT